MTPSSSLVHDQVVFFWLSSTVHLAIIIILVYDYVCKDDNVAKVQSSHEIFAFDDDDDDVYWNESARSVSMIKQQFLSIDGFYSLQSIEIFAHIIYSTIKDIILRTLKTLEHRNWRGH